MKNKLLVATIVCAVIAATAYAAFALPTFQEYRGQKWEYAGTAHFRESNFVAILAPTEEEQAELNAAFMKIPSDELSSTKIHNVMGAHGWELIISELVNSTYFYTYKRPMQ